MILEPRGYSYPNHCLKSTEVDPSEVPVLPGRMFDKLDAFEIGWKNIFLMLGPLNQINYLKHLSMNAQFVGGA